MAGICLDPGIRLRCIARLQ